ncbi:MAG: holo-[acyl-carrier protein] synthase [Solirubrobacterales bacterium]|jgi:holo-[acyl-carrier protein] synthase|nr:holo-[acyl-carrier protein] synthase [Solirubrobacterales bacterium]
MSAGVGIDLIEIERLERALERYPRLAARLFSEDELAYARARRRPGRHLAARFAAKEAALKALGARGGFGLGDIEVIAGEPPRLRLAGAAAAAAERRGVELQVSLTHSRESAAAVAVASPRLNR